MILLEQKHLNTVPYPVPLGRSVSKLVFNPQVRNRSFNAVNLALPTNIIKPQSMRLYYFQNEYLTRPSEHRYRMCSC